LQNLQSHCLSSLHLVSLLRPIEKGERDIQKNEHQTQSLINLIHIVKEYLSTWILCPVLRLKQILRDTLYLLVFQYLSYSDQLYAITQQNISKFLGFLVLQDFQIIHD